MTTELEEYQEWVETTLNDGTMKGMNNIPTSLRPFWCSTALVREASEVMEHFEKHLRKGIELSEDNVAEELGDVLWYLACMANLIGRSLDDIMLSNIQKINGRVYGQGG